MYRTNWLFFHKAAKRYVICPLVKRMKGIKAKISGVLCFMRARAYFSLVCKFAYLLIFER
jgi:hypothetical protein